MARGSRRLKRLAKLGSLTGRVTTSYVADKVRDTFRGKDLRERAKRRLHIDNAREIVETVGKLKGAAMKVGQQMAMAARALDLPEEVTQTLSQLHADADPIPFKIIKEDVEKELEGPIDSAFAFFDPEPLGTASLGQAHAATLPGGGQVVVKVLHRGVEHSVDTDLMALKTILLSGRVLRRSREEMSQTFDEIRARLIEELDYLQEAANIYAFEKLFANDQRVRIPRLHQHLCTERILTMDRLPGIPIQEFVRHGSPEAQQRAGRSLVEIYFTQAFRFLTLHADPHPGNYLFEDDGRIGLLDFGCVKRFDEFWMGRYAQAAAAVMEGDRQACLDACEALGCWDGQNAEAAEVIWDFCRVMGRVFAMGEITLGADEDTGAEIRPIIKRLMVAPQIQIPRHVLYLHRSLGGTYSLCKTLKTRADFGAIAMPEARHAVRRAEGKQ